MWRIVSSPDFDDDYLRMEIEPYVGLQQGEIDGRIEGEGRVGFSFAGMDELDEVHGRGSCGSRERRRTSCWRITRAIRSRSSANGLHS
jgi:hypothetical protein